MTRKRKYTPYKIPSAWKGDTLTQVSQKFDQAFVQSIQELADEETKTWGSKHGVAAVLMNLTLRNTEYIRTQRARLRKRYIQLKQEEKQHHDQHAKEQAISKEFN